MSLQDVEMIFRFIGGLGMFLYGMHVMSDGLQKSAGNKTKRLMQVLTKNRFMAVLAGIAVTAVLQSSSATTVMVVGFVNAGIMDLAQAVGGHYGSQYRNYRDKLDRFRRCLGVCPEAGFFCSPSYWYRCVYTGVCPEGGKTPGWRDYGRSGNPLYWCVIYV